jgi:hypothetical protein
LKEWTLALAPLQPWLDIGTQMLMDPPPAVIVGILLFPLLLAAVGRRFWAAVGAFLFAGAAVLVLVQPSHTRITLAAALYLAGLCVALASIGAWRRHRTTVRELAALREDLERLLGFEQRRFLSERKTNKAAAPPPNVGPQPVSQREPE